MCDQPIAVKRDPFAREVTRFVRKPFEFGPAIVSWCCGLPAKRAFPIFDGQVNSLVFCERQGFQRAQYTLLVDGLKMYRHDNSSVPGSVAAVQTRAS
jgi:hypothetical protein